MLFWFLNDNPPMTLFHSAFIRSNLQGRIYIEARDPAAVVRAFSVKSHVLRPIVPKLLDDPARVLSMRNLAFDSANLTPGTWVKPKKGVYSGNLALVVNGELDRYITVLVVPRILVNLQSSWLNAAKCKRHMVIP
jgi:hypothetical protein